MSSPDISSAFSLLKDGCSQISLFAASMQESSTSEPPSAPSLWMLSGTLVPGTGGWISGCKPIIWFKKSEMCSGVSSSDDSSTLSDSVALRSSTTLFSESVSGTPSFSKCVSQVSSLLSLFSEVFSKTSFGTSDVAAVDSRMESGSVSSTLKSLTTEGLIFRHVQSFRNSLWLLFDSKTAKTLD